MTTAAVRISREARILTRLAARRVNSLAALNRIAVWIERWCHSVHSIFVLVPTKQTPALPVKVS